MSHASTMSARLHPCLARKKRLFKLSIDTRLTQPHTGLMSDIFSSRAQGSLRLKVSLISLRVKF